MSNETISFSFAVAVFLITLLIILFEKVHRMIIAAVGATLMVSGGLILGFYDEHTAIEAIDSETLGLLLGMMTIVALLDRPVSSSIWQSGQVAGRAASPSDSSFY